MTFAALGDSAVTVTLGPALEQLTLRRVRVLTAALERARLPMVVDIVPAYASVTVFYDPARWAGGTRSPFADLCHAIDLCASAARVRARRPPRKAAIPRRIEIPVCYGGEFGPDLAEVAAHAGLAPAEVAKRHSAAKYEVQAIGFAPGFPYLAGLPEKLHCPRRPTPRELVAAGSVGIGGAQTGIYSLATPGGWQVIGRTPLRIFRPEESPPTLLRVGDKVRFRPITPEEYAAWK